jgi:hypothetical protein
MKTFVRRARRLGGTVADAVRRAVDPPLTADARPIEIKRAIVEEVEQLVEPAGGGRRLLPGDSVQVTILTERHETQTTLEAVLADLRERLVARLMELQCGLPRQFSVQVTYVATPPAGWEPGQRLEVNLTWSEPAGEHDSFAIEELPSLTVTVVRGHAECMEATFRARAVRLGRSASPTDERGRPRVNDVAFLEDDSPENRTVTRGHALIRFNGESGGYRLFDEGSSNGTRVLRDGEIFELSRRDPVGFSLKSGDEVQLGKAAVRVQIETA